MRCQLHDAACARGIVCTASNDCVSETAADVELSSARAAISTCARTDRLPAVQMVVGGASSTVLLRETRYPNSSPTRTLAVCSGGMEYEEPPRARFARKACRSAVAPVIGGSRLVRALSLALPSSKRG